MMALIAPQMARPAVRIIGDAGSHQQAADIGKAEAGGAVVVGQFGDRRDGNCAIITEISSTIIHSRQACSKLSTSKASVSASTRLLVAEGEQVQGREIAGGVVEEHIFRARVRGADRAGRGAGVPVVHRRVEMQARIGRWPGGVADLFPQLARLQRLHDLAVLAGGKVPVAVVLDGAQERRPTATRNCWSSGRRR